jgi:FMN phosphatase YigB (HAD superfamily)
MSVPAVIFDMDGTLTDVRGIRHYVIGKDRNFHKFHTESVNCPPNREVVEWARFYRWSGFKILIVTAREFRYAFHTMFWLSLNGVQYDELYMRRNKDYREDGIIKREILELIRNDGYHIVHAWDDNPNVIKVWQSEGIAVTVVEGYGFD